MQGKTSRAGVFAGLRAGAWVVAFEREDLTEDPVYNYRNLNFHVHADHLNQANVEVIVQDSDDGSTWVNRNVVAAPLVPGGEMSVSTSGRGRWIRTLVYSTAVGRVDFTIQDPEDQVIPGLWPDVNTLSCASYCEISSES